MKNKSIYSCSLIAFASLFSSTVVFAANQCTPNHKPGDCSCWIKAGGYCTAYIKNKTGKSQHGDANTWTSNIQSSQVKKGDVAIFRSLTHVAYIEDVIKDKKGKPVSVKISEYNWGPKKIDKDCIVTDKFGVVNHRTVDIGKVDGGFWRP